MTLRIWDRAGEAFESTFNTAETFGMQRVKRSLIASRSSWLAVWWTPKREKGLGRWIIACALFVKRCWRLKRQMSAAVAIWRITATGLVSAGTGKRHTRLCVNRSQSVWRDIVSIAGSSRRKSCCIAADAYRPSIAVHDVNMRPGQSTSLHAPRLSRHRRDSESRDRVLDHRCAGCGLRVNGYRAAATGRNGKIDNEKYAYVEDYP